MRNHLSPRGCLAVGVIPSAAYGATDAATVSNEKDYLRCRQRLWQQAFGLALTAMAKKTANLKPEQTA